MENAPVISWLTQYLKDPLRRNSFFLIVANIVMALFGFLFWMVAARLADSDKEIGLATALVSAIVLLTTFSRLGVDIGLIRFLPNEGNKQSIINTSLTIVGLFSILVALIFVLGLRVWSPALLFVRENILYLLLFALFTGAASLMTLLQQGVFVALRTTKFSFIMQAVAGLRLLLLVFLASFGAFAIFSSWGIALCVAFMVGIILIRRLEPKYRPLPGVNKKIVNDMLHFSLGNYIAESFKELPGCLLPLLVVNILNPEMGAYFYIAWTIAGIVFMISYATNFSLLAEGSYQPEKLRSNVIQSTKFIFLLLIPIILVIFFFGDLLLSFFGEAYSKEGLKLLWILAFSGIPLALNTIYITTKRIQKQVKPIIYIYIFIALFTIGVGYVLMRGMGLVGIGVAWILSNSIVTLFIGLAMIRRRAKRL